MARKASVAVPAKAKAPTAEKPKRISRKTTPSPETLAALGLERLTDLVLAETARNPAFRKLVTAAIAGLQGPDAVAALVDRRLTALERARGYIDWQKRRAFAADLDATVSAIVRELTPLSSTQALDRLVRFLAGAAGVLERVDDSTGRVLGIYERAAHEAAAIAASLPGAEAVGFAAGLVAHLAGDPFGMIEALLLTLVPSLPDDALAPLDADLASAAEAATPRKDRDWNGEMRLMRLMRLRQALADRRGDVDGYVALEQAVSPERPDRVAVAERLLAADRAKEALAWITRPQARGVRVVTREALIAGTVDGEQPERERIALEIRIREALGEREAAQRLRWARFEETLDRGMLRDYLAKLPDFEDDEALERAFDHAAAHAQPYRALHFFVNWPNLDRAARLVEARRGRWEGDRYEVLGPAAAALEDAYPLIASRLYRLLLDDILANGRSHAYGHGARYLARLDALADRLEPGSLSPDPAAYREGLRKAYGRKSSFWMQVKG